MYQLISNVRRVLFIIAFVLATVAVWEKVANLFSFTVVSARALRLATSSSRISCARRAASARAFAPLEFEL